jgi:hypothetical protein
MAQAGATKARNDLTVFSQRKATRRKRLIRLKRRSTRWRSLQRDRSMALLRLRWGSA